MQWGECQKALFAYIAAICCIHTIYIMTIYTPTFWASNDSHIMAQAIHANHVLQLGLRDILLIERKIFYLLKVPKVIVSHKHVSNY